jgi:hypothetical protein
MKKVSLVVRTDYCEESLQLIGGKTIDLTMESRKNVDDVTLQTTIPSAPYPS